MSGEEREALIRERFSLAYGRVREIREEPGMAEPFADFFVRAAGFLETLVEASDIRAACGIDGGATDGAGGGAGGAASIDAAEWNRRLYADILRGAYEHDYSNPAYAAERLGEPFYRPLCLLAAYVRDAARDAFRGEVESVLIAMELIDQVHLLFADEGGPSEAEVRDAVYWHFSDYGAYRIGRGISRMIDPAEDFEARIVMGADLSDPGYLYRYGAYIGENEIRVSSYLNGRSEEEIAAMADAFTEGYRIGFSVTGKDLGKKKTAEIRYPIGFERVVRRAVQNFKKMNLSVTMRAEGTSPNRQYDYDHREDRAYYLDKPLIERGLSARREYLKGREALAAGYAGPAVIESFGEEPFSPESKGAALRYDAAQQQLCTYEMAEAGDITNQYIKGEERSFTIISFPLPEIGSRFEDIFAETVKINTLDYALYRDMQQRLIDALDGADRVRVTGRGDNPTEIFVKIRHLDDPSRETAFENCVADVNIPVGEVFTTPVLRGTCGRLFVSEAYLNGLRYSNLDITFEDGMAVSYGCSNFESAEEGVRYIRENVMMHHEALPMGEFAIGTNTLAYRMARDYGIADRMPILIAEKAGPHFALGDTCYSHEEDNASYNPDGKRIIARENDFSLLRNDPSAREKAYFNCHTDITIPYDELGEITALRPDGGETAIFAGGRFVLPGTEPLNGPLEGI